MLYLSAVIVSERFTFVVWWYCDRSLLMPLETECTNVLYAFGVISFGGWLYESESFLIAFNGKLTRLCKSFMLI